MGRKRTAEEKRKYAEENGFKDDDTDVDDNPVPRDVLDDTKERYDVQMGLWLEYKTTHPEATPYHLKTQIKTTLREYREALIFESTLASIPPPDRKTLKAFRFNFFHGRPEDSTSFPILGGHSAGLYEDSDDLVALQASKPPDRLTILCKTILASYSRHEDNDNTTHTVADPLVSFASGKKIATFVSYLSTMLAALLLIGAILVLYKTRSNDVKLGLLALFAVIFAASVGLLTNGTRAEVFGLTAAYVYTS